MPYARNNYLFDNDMISAMKFGFFKRLASARDRRRYNIVRTDREADYMCFSPLQRKTSELEGEEYTSRLVSGIT
jgi:hypothetical protein